MKICSKCGVEKPLEQFGKHYKGKDGHRNQCKMCLLKIASDRYYNNIENRNKKRIYIKEWRRINYQTARNYDNELHRRWRTKEVNKARSSVEKMDRINICEVCGSTSVTHAHHHDYNKPIDVIWCCPPCHRQIHIANKRLLSL